MARPFSVLLVLLVFGFFRLFFPVSSVSAAGPYYHAACSASTGAYSINLTVSGIEPTFTHGGGNDFVLFYLTFKGLDSELSPATKETIKQILGTPGYQNPSDAGDFAYRVTNELPVLSVAEGKYFVTTSVTDSTRIGNLTFGQIKERLPNVPLHIAANLNLDGVWISKYVGGKTFYVKSGQCSNAHIPPAIPAGCPYVDCSGNIVCPAGFELDRRSCPTCTCTPINKVTKTWSVRAVIDGCTGGKILNRNIRFFSASWTEGQNHPNAFYWDQQPYTKELTRTVNINNYTPNDTLFFGLESDLVVTKNKWGGSYGGGTAQANQELQPVGTKPHASMEYGQSFNPYTWMVSFPRESVPAGTYEVHFKIPDQYVSSWCVDPPSPPPAKVLVNVKDAQGNAVNVDMYRLQCLESSGQCSSSFFQNNTIASCRHDSRQSSKSVHTYTLDYGFCKGGVGIELNPANQVILGVTGTPSGYERSDYSSSTTKKEVNITWSTWNNATRVIDYIVGPGPSSLACRGVSLSNPSFVRGTVSTINLVCSRDQNARKYKLKIYDNEHTQIGQPNTVGLAQPQSGNIIYPVQVSNLPEGTYKYECTPCFDADMVQCATTPATSCVANLTVLAPDPCPRLAEGNANCDGEINDADYQVWKQAMSGVTPSCAHCSADFNRNGRVDLADFEIWRNTVYR